MSSSELEGRRANYMFTNHFKAFVDEDYNDESKPCNISVVRNYTR